MKNSVNLIRVPFYSSWIGLIVFVILIIFQPSRMTFYAIRPADVWLLFCLILQYLNGYNTVLPFQNRFPVKYYGLFVGILAIVATLVQAAYSNTPLEVSFIFVFYRFIRFLLIFKFAENILKGFSSEDARKFWRVYTYMGVFTILLSFLEFYSIEPFKHIIMNLYYERPDAELDEYLIQVDRLAGLMGNPNTTALLILTTLIYPFIRLISKKVSFITRIFYTGYILSAVFVLLVMTGSRSSIFTLALLFAVVIFSKLHKLEELLLVVVLTLLLTVTGFLLYNQFKSEIIIQDRVTGTMQGESFEFSLTGIAKWSGRYDLWQHRFNTFKLEGNQLAVLIGIGYTTSNEDYADNGFISTFLNNGIIGLLFKLLLFYIFVTKGLLRAIRHFRRNEIDTPYMVFALSAFALLLWEMTADLTDHYKLGQLFFLFLSITLFINSKILHSKKQ